MHGVAGFGAEKEEAESPAAEQEVIAEDDEDDAEELDGEIEEDTNNIGSYRLESGAATKEQLAQSSVQEGEDGT